MKISKIVSVALLSAGISNIAFAQVTLNDLQGLKDESEYSKKLVAEQEAQERAKTLTDNVAALQKYGVNKIHQYASDDKALSESERKGIENAFKNIFEARKTLSQELNLQNDGQNTFTATKAAGGQNGDLTFKIKNVDTTIKFGDADFKEKLKKIFTEENKAYLDAIFEKFKGERDNRLKNTFHKETMDEAGKLVEQNGDNVGTLAKLKHLDELYKHLDESIANKQKDAGVKKTQQTELENKFKSTSDLVKNKEKALEEFNKAVKTNAPAGLANANKAGNANITGDGATVAKDEDFDGDVATNKLKGEIDKVNDNDKKQALTNAFNAVKQAIDSKEESLKAFNKYLKDNGLSLKNANKAGNDEINGNAKPAKDEDFGEAADNKLKGEIGKVAKTAEDDLKKAQAATKTLRNAIADDAGKTFIADMLEHIKDPKKADTAAKDLADKQAAFDKKLTEEKFMEAVEKDKDSFKLRGTSFDAISKQAHEVSGVKTALDNGGDNSTKKENLIKAIEAGIIVKKDNKVYTKSDIQSLEDGKVDEIVNLAKASAAKADTVFQKVKNAADEAKKASETLDKAKTFANVASNARAKAISEKEGLNTKEGDVLASFSDAILSNTTVQEVMSTVASDKIADLSKNLNTSFEQSSSLVGKAVTTDIINFSTGLATNTRLAKLANPYNADLALAQAINNLAGEAFADAGDSLSSVVKQYTNRFNNDNNLWGSILGGKGKFANAANPSVWGLTLGYDKAFDNTIVGGFLNYTKSEASDTHIKHESDNYGFGVYSRSYFGQNELDAKFGFGFGKNDLERYSLVGDSKADYDSKFFDLAVDYGYVFDLGNAKFIKPIFGLAYVYAKSDEITENGKVPAKFNSVSSKVLTAKLAAEFRAYAENGSYFYITPGIEKELSKSVDDLNVNFVGSNKMIKYAADKKKDTFFVLKTGAEFKITNSLSTNINFGAKAKSKKEYYDGTIGLSYKF
ncbi:MAG: autotransporter domain-containing protein [Campylobacter sp.]